MPDKRQIPQHPRVPPLTVRRLLARTPSPAHAVAVDAPVRAALQAMAEHAVRAVVVVDGSRVVGVFSENAAASRDPAATLEPLRQAIDGMAVVATGEQTVQECIALMDEKRVRYLPVCEDGRLIGLLTLDDLLRGVIAHYELVFRELELDQRILFLRGTYSC